ncbi:MAG TPA: twin-arginine translocase TatA/TatE family subunit [Enteractinococcus helveticum]|uniref:Sec-independent protein translocase protein TatA n=1 Tax=Enteractinococcus helveticum TaxID=1837282 RepID=A0A921FNI4_9MICC|nr:twin-arginine translocase TatA/TatE family subunit [Enteractinococcus helveticum]HJF14562.1 twin-arginine translocase TatA/TatE family subunit [Enteractinococcus helveticum]
MQIFRNPVILLVLILLAFLLFGANKLPKMARNLGQSMRILKSEVKEMKTDEKDGKNKKSSSDGDVEAVEGTVISNGETSTQESPKGQTSN